MANRGVIIAILVGCGMVAIGLGVGLGIGLSNRSSDPETTDPPPQESEKSIGENYRFASVTADNERCSTIGTEIMAKKGGSATDAAVAALICLGVINAQSAGVGGGALFTIYDTPRNEVNKEWQSLVARETAPLWAHKDLFKDNPNAQGTGVWSIMSPGDLNGYYAAWAKYGRVAWKDLFQPSIDLARNGWSVSKHMETAIASSIESIKADPGLKEQYLKSDESPYVEGDEMKDPKLGDTLEKISEDPAWVDRFYSGDLAADIVADIRDAGGNLTVEDLRNNSVQWNSPIQVSLNNGYKLYGTYPPSSSIMVGFIMKIMEGYQMQPGDLKDNAKKALFLHRLAESFKMTFARRSLFLGDPDYIDENVLNKWLSDLGDDTYVDNVRNTIKDDSVLDDYSPSGSTSANLELPGGTTHLNAVGPDGGFVGITSTVGSFFGSKVRGVRTGIVFGNLFNLFDHRSSMDRDPTNTVNHIAPGKRPRSSTGCVMIVDSQDRPVITAGGSGGPRIITASAQVLVQAMWGGLNITDSVDESRVYATNGSPNKLYHDPMPQEILDILKSKGHTDQEAIPSSTFDYLAVVQGIDTRACHEQSPPRECIQGVSDRRKNGRPDGY